MIFVTSKKVFIKLLVMHIVSFALIGFFSYVSITEKEYNLDHSTCTLTINFLVPMDKKSLEDNLTLTYEYPIKEVTHYTITWISSRKVQIKFYDLKLPKGQLVTYKIKNAKTKIPLINKKLRGSFRIPTKPKIIGFSKGNGHSSQKPLIITFNVPILEDSIKENIKVKDTNSGKEIEGSFTPFEYKESIQPYVDKSKWLFKPLNNFRNEAQYQIEISSNLMSESKQRLGKNYFYKFKIASKPQFIDHKPTNDAKETPLYPVIEVKANENLKKGEIVVRRENYEQNDIVPGKTLVQKNSLVFIPKVALLPASRYKVEVTGVSVYDEKSEKHVFYFQTKDIIDYWIDVRLGPIHTVTVYRGQEVIRHMVASGGREESRTPLGTFYAGDRGYSFWSHRFGEGALYWVRLVGQILIHSVPRDHKGEIKKEEHEKLGLPASHGCIRLDDNDAKWVFENIPVGTPVIIHE